MQTFYLKTNTEIKTLIFILEAPRDEAIVVEDNITDWKCLVAVFITCLYVYA